MGPECLPTEFPIFEPVPQRGGSQSTVSMVGMGGGYGGLGQFRLDFHPFPKATLSASRLGGEPDG